MATFLLWHRMFTRRFALLTRRGGLEKSRASKATLLLAAVGTTVGLWKQGSQPPPHTSPAPWPHKGTSGRGIPVLPWRHAPGPEQHCLHAVGVPLVVQQGDSCALPVLLRILWDHHQLVSKILDNYNRALHVVVKPDFHLQSSDTLTGPGDIP